MILFLTPMLPDPDGHGGSQRAAFLLQAMRQIAPVHFGLLVPAPLPPTILDHIRPDTASANVIILPGTVKTAHLLPGMPWSLSNWIDLFRFGSFECPRLSGRQLRAVADQLPVTDVDIAFGGRSQGAHLLEDLIARGLVRTRIKVAELDDIMSRSRRRQLDAEGPRLGRLTRSFIKAETALILRAEQRIVDRWDAVSVCSNEDVAVLQEDFGARAAFRIPNVVARPRLPVTHHRPFRLLFVGSMKHPPNRQGLERFLNEAWPIIARERPDIAFDVVAMFATDALRARLSQLGIALHADVPSVQPFYESSDAVIAPIFFGGGTRIKILEAMAFGRLVISTSQGIEGLDIRDGEHALIADDMTRFARSIIDIADDPARSQAMVEKAHALQQQSYGIDAMLDAVRTMLTVSPVPPVDTDAAC